MMTIKKKERFLRKILNFYSFDLRFSFKSNLSLIIFRMSEISFNLANKVTINHLFKASWKLIPPRHYHSLKMKSFHAISILFFQGDFNLSGYLNSEYQMDFWNPRIDLEIFNHSLGSTNSLRETLVNEFQWNSSIDRECFGLIFIISIRL